jgi:hypothetical protein
MNATTGMNEYPTQKATYAHLPHSLSMRGTGMFVPRATRARRRGLAFPRYDHLDLRADH